MKQLRFLTILAALAIPPTWAIHHVQARRAQEIRETAYQAKLRSYTEALKPGMFRADVEQYLQKQGTKPQQMCCVGTYDKAVSIDELQASINARYGKFALAGFETTPLKLWRIEPEKFAISLSVAEDGMKQLIYLKFGAQSVRPGWKCRFSK